MRLQGHAWPVAAGEITIINTVLCHQKYKGEGTPQQRSTRRRQLMTKMMRFYFRHMLTDNSLQLMFHAVRQGLQCSALYYMLVFFERSRLLCRVEHPNSQ